VRDRVRDLNAGSFEISLSKRALGNWRALIEILLRPLIGNSWLGGTGYRPISLHRNSPTRRTDEACLKMIRFEQIRVFIAGS